MYLSFIQVHFRSINISGDGTVRKISDDLVKELDSLFTIVQSQIHSIENSLTQVDAYQQVRYESYYNYQLNFMTLRSKEPKISVRSLLY